MDPPERQLRLVQVACALFLIACVLLIHFGHGNREPSAGMNFTQSLVIVAAIWSAVSGFTLQRRIVSAPKRSQAKSARSTPFSRWKNGHIARLWSATSVCMWGLIMYEIRGPSWIVDSLVAVGVILLVTWKPGASPSAE
jgi:hypothetical protein